MSKHKKSFSLTFFNVFWNILDLDEKWLGTGPDNMILEEKAETDDSLDADSILQNFLEVNNNSSIYKIDGNVEKHSNCGHVIDFS